MPAAGKLIVIEGIDGAGKHTQSELLKDALATRGIDCQSFSFPRYESFFGLLIARFLNGEFGQLAAVDPRLSAMLYAGDRWEAKPDLQAALVAGNVVILDRYVGSNLAHQGARVDAAGREEFLAWLRKLEYGLYGLPAEDLVILLRQTPAQAQEFVARKTARDYTERKHDLQEADIAHLQRAAEVYDELARDRNWVVVDCAAGNVPRKPEEIHREVLAAVESRVISRSTAS